ncbi:hypothetical protein Pint_34586 [Pistacia integerrima]|uniref:Uncharacterized protein n=1 Tax=Pistacia integerrima TaxID=434235 RepID=A0ACC0X550_9ROSI|nr:hypothetical protein Pint_34586 [Pistacia integerrima]
MNMRSLRDALVCHVQAIKAGFTLPTFTTNELMHVYSKHDFLHESQKLFDEMPERDVSSWNAMISAHVKTQNLKQARELFDSAPHRDLVTYNSMLSGYASADGYEADALNLFREMQNECYGRQLHTFMVKTGADVSGITVSSLIDMYSKCACFEDAYRVFNRSYEVVDLVTKNSMVAACCRAGEMEMALKIFWRVPELNDVVSWTTLISGYVQNGYMEEGLKLFVCMAEAGVRWNERTFASVLSACSGLRSLKRGKEVHACVLKNGLISNKFINSGIFNVYYKCENMKYAELIYLMSRVENSFSIIKLILGYSSQGNMVEARRFFDSLAEKNAVVWTALFSGYVKARQYEAVFELFSDLSKETMVSEPLILVSVLGACALQAALNPGMEIHAYMLKMGLGMHKKLISTVVDMYSQCGNLTYAETVFQSVVKRDTILYNVMISGYAHHGHEIKAIQLFEEMLRNRIKPNMVTFLEILSACRQCGLVELGEKYFNSMTVDYNILPETDHYACMIDLYGRANQLEKAIGFMKRIPIEQDPVISGVILNACRLSKNAKLAREQRETELTWEGKEANEREGEEISWLQLDVCGKWSSYVYLGGRSHSKTEAIYSMNCA